MVALKMVGVGLLVSMVYLKDAVVGTNGDKEPDGTMLALLVVVYLVRTGLMNCTYPLEESILMDFVPSHTRARRKSLDSVSVFGWCGSAALGGYLADRFGYTFTFLVTASIQGTATLLQATLMLVVPRSEQPTSSATSAALAAVVVAEAEPDGPVTVAGSVQ